MTVRDSGGNVQVDFVWGNFPLQPNDDRGLKTLDPTLDNHSIATTGWANFPGFIANYEGDGDTGFEFVVPTLLRKTLDEANDILAQYEVGTWDTAHYLTVSNVTSTGKTVRVTAYDEAYANWSNTANQALNGLRVGDEVNLSALVDGSDVSLEFGSAVKVTKVNNDGDQSWFEFKTATALNLDTAASGTVYAGPNLVNVITVVRPNRDAGTIQQVDGQGIPVRYFGEAPAFVTFTPGNGYDQGFISSSAISFTNYSNALLAALGANTGETWTVTASYNATELGSYTVGRSDFANFSTIAGFDGLNGMPGGLRGIDAVDVNSGAKTMTVYVGAGQM